MLRSFAIVFMLSMLILFGSVFILVTTGSSLNPLYSIPVVRQLQSYYRANQSWQGVQSLVTDPDLGSLFDWERMLLLDPNGQILLDHGQPASSRSGQQYERGLGDFTVLLLINGETAGMLVLEPGALSHPLQGLAYLSRPLLFVAILLGALALLIGLLLMRRVVDPLAEVIAASQAVADGDLSARVRLPERRDDLRALSDHFNAMAVELERSDRARRNLLADVSHELRTPLTILRGRLEGILDGVYPADEAHIAPALEEAYLLERLVDDLQLLALAEAGQLRYEPQRFDLGELALRSIALMHPQADEKAISLRTQITSGLPPACADPQRIEQVIGNLLGNALRYTPDGGEVLLSVYAQDGGVSLSVADSGSGVPGSDLPNIFDRFWRGEKSRARHTGGAGLGLAIARQLIEAQGGRIEAANRLEGGLVVQFWLPE